MNTAIYYFSGTGNSLFIARRLGDILTGQFTIHPIRTLTAAERVNVTADLIILVFPVYFQTLPDIVMAFLNKAQFEKSSPDIYGIATCNGGPGHAMFTMKRMLHKRGYSLKAGFCITMPGNSLIIRDFTNPEEIRNQRLRDCHFKIEEISGYIRRRESGRMDGTDRFRSHLQGLVTDLVAKRIYRTPSKFCTSDLCTRCGTCVRLCPANNISIENTGVVWGSRCEQCLACFHWCPQKAVEIGKFTAGKLRYHHPDISLGDM